MTEEKEERTENPTIEKIEAVGQVVIGEIEKIGGILTADSITQAEGEYNISAGTLRGENAEALEETEEDK